MGNLSTKSKDKVPTVEVTCCTVHEYIAERIKNHGSKVAQVDALTGEKVTFDAILDRSAALAAGLSARGLRAGEVALIMGENNVHYPWVLLGVLQTGASAHLINPRSTPREVTHALSISRPMVSLVSAEVSQQRGVTAALRESPNMRHMLVWGTGGNNVQGDVDGDLPDGIASIEQLIVSPAKSASSMPCSPPSDAKTPPGPSRGEVPVLSVKDIAPGLAMTPTAPPPTPTSLGATYGDSCSPTAASSTAASPLQTFLVHAVDGVPQPQNGSSVAFVLLSSGSTGMPKGVMLTHENVLAALELGPVFMREDDVMAGLSPYFHAYGGILMLMALCAGVPVVALGRFSMAALMDAVEEHKITVMHVVSSLLVSMSKLPAEKLSRLKALRRIWSGAAQISPLVQSALQSRLPGVLLSHCYGMTETTFTPFCGEVRADKPGSPGLLIQSMACKVVDPETRKTQPMGARGELCFRGAMVMRGYLANPEATAEAFDAEGWLMSGDLGFVDEDGYYYIVERLKDVLKYNGHQVSPSELEALLTTHPAVSEAAVIGEPHEYGDAPRALVVLADGEHVTEEELQSFIAGKVAPHKQLRGGITFLTSPFPRTASGKLQRKKLRALLEDPDSSIVSSTTEESISPPNSPAPAPAPPASTIAPAAPASTEAPAPPAATLDPAPPTTVGEPEFAPAPPASTVEPSPAPAPASAFPVPVSEADVAALTVGMQQAHLNSSTPEAQRVQEANAEPDDEAFASEAETVAVEAQPQPRPHHRPSVVSTTSLSTIYSESPLSSPCLLSPDSVIMPTPPSIAALKLAASVPLPLSEPNSPSVANCSQGSCPMDIDSNISESNDN